MLTRALFLTASWFVISLVATLAGGAKLRRTNIFFSTIWLSIVLMLGNLWALLTFGIPWEILATSALVFIFGLFCFWWLRDWNAFGQVTWITTVVATAMLIAYAFAITAFSPLNPISFMVALIFFFLEAVALTLALTHTYENLEAMCRVRWRHRVEQIEPIPGFSPKVSLHVPAYDEPPEVVEETLRSLAQLDYPDYEVLVIDNNTPKEETWRPLQALCQELGPRFKFLHLEQWPGYKSGALNFALTQTAPEAEIISIVDADYRLSPNFLRETVPVFQDPLVAFLQAPQDFRDFKGNSYLESIYYSYKYFFEVSMPVRNEYNAIIFAGTMGLIRKSVLQQIGGWDEWCITEDAEASLRILKLGYKSLYYKKSFGQGLMPYSFDGLKKQRFRWCFGGMQILKKHWEKLMPWAHLVDPTNKLTFAQRYFYLVGGLQWFTDVFNLLFAFFLILGGVLSILSGNLTVRPLTGPLMILPAVFLLLHLWRFGWVLRHIMHLPWGVAFRSMYGFFSAGWVVALACFQGLIQPEGVFLRTPKSIGHSKLLNALRVTQWEAGIGLLCVGTALAAFASHPNLYTLFLAVLLIWQASLYLSAPAYSLMSVTAAAAGPGALRGGEVGRRGILEHWAARWAISLATALLLIGLLLQFLPQPAQPPEYSRYQPPEIPPQRLIGLEWAPIEERAFTPTPVPTDTAIPEPANPVPPTQAPAIPSATATATAPPTGTSVVTASPTMTGTVTTPVGTGTITPTATVSATATPGPTTTVTPTVSVTAATVTATPVITGTATPTAPVTATPVTATPASTASPTLQPPATITATSPATPIVTPIPATDTPAPPIPEPATPAPPPVEPTAEPPATTEPPPPEAPAPAATTEASLSKIAGEIPLMAGFQYVSLSVPAGMNFSPASDPSNYALPGWDDRPDPNIKPKLQADAVFIRLNQVGYFPEATKVAVAMADTSLTGRFRVERMADGEVVLAENIGPDQGEWGSFSHHYLLDFSVLTAPGHYRLYLPDGSASTVFAISPMVYNDLAGLSLQFFRVQRSGDTNPAGHAPSHRQDAPLSTNPNQSRNVSGGWYDAGDYLKFTLTNAYVTLFQLLAYRDAAGAFQKWDSDGVPLILNEAQVGLDWLERMWDGQAGMLYVQVGSEADHTQPWVRPEDDPLSGSAQRPVYPAEAGKGANLAGKTAAAFAVAAEIYGDEASPVYDQAQAARYRQLAEDIYAWGEARPASQASFPDYFYNETTWKDDIALAAAELYRLTGQERYLQAARRYAQEMGPAYWFSWEALNGLALNELARIDPENQALYLDFLRQDLMSFEASRQATPWGMVHGDHLVWGSLYPVLGAALEARWYEQLSGDTTYQALIQSQLDYALGRNPWGVSFLIGAGANWPRQPHHRIAELNLKPLGLELTGAWVGGPAVPSVFNDQAIALSGADEYARFQSDQAVYHDDVRDYVTNEPSGALNATALLLLAQLARPESEAGSRSAD